MPTTPTPASILLAGCLLAACSGGADSDTNTDTDDVAAGNPCSVDETHPLEDDGTGVLGVGYCPAFSSCGEWSPECIDLQLERDAGGVYRIVGLNMDVLNPSHGDQWSGTVTGFENLPEDTRVEVDLELTGLQAGSGDIAFTFSGANVTIHEMNDPHLNDG